MFKKSEINSVVEEIRSNKNEDLGAVIMYDTSDYTIWVDFLLQNESKRYRSNTIHRIEWDDYYYHTDNLKKVNTEDLVKYITNRIKLQVDANS